MSADFQEERRSSRDKSSERVFTRGKESKRCDFEVIIFLCSFLKREGRRDERDVLGGYSRRGGRKSVQSKWLTSILLASAYFDRVRLLYALFLRIKEKNIENKDLFFNVIVDVSHIGQSPVLVK